MAFLNPYETDIATASSSTRTHGATLTRHLVRLLENGHSGDDVSNIVPNDGPLQRQRQIRKNGGLVEGTLVEPAQKNQTHILHS